MKLLHKVGRRDESMNCRPIAIISVICKLCMQMVRERIDIWREDSGLLGERQGCFRRGRYTEDNLFMLDRLIQMVKGRKTERQQTTQHTSGGAVTAVLTSCCSNCVETFCPQQMGPDFLGKSVMRTRWVAGPAPHKGG